MPRKQSVLTYEIGKYTGQTLKSVKPLTLDPMNMSEISVYEEQIRAARDLLQALRHDLVELTDKVDSMNVRLTMIVHKQAQGAWRGRWRITMKGVNHHGHWEDLGIILETFPKEIQDFFVYANERAHQLYIQEAICIHIIRLTNNYLEGKLSRRPKRGTLSVEDLARMIQSKQALMNPGTKTK